MTKKQGQRDLGDTWLMAASKGSVGVLEPGPSWWLMATGHVTGASCRIES